MWEVLHRFVLLTGFSARTHMVEVLGLAANGLRLEVTILRFPELIGGTLSASADMLTSAAPENACVFGLLRNHYNFTVSIFKRAVLRN